MDLTFAVIGPGAVGSVLIHSLRQAGMTVASVHGRHDKLEIPSDVNAVAICTPDDVISDVASLLASTSPDWSGRIVFHVSGVLTSEILKPLGTPGAATASFHPLSSYPTDGPERDLRDTTIAIEGDPNAINALTALATKLGAHPIRLDAGQKEAYHLAASMASNFLATLTGAVQDVLDNAGLDRHLMDGLVADTVRNLKRTDSGNALTGPIVRGDVETVRRHVATLQKVAPEWLPFYLEAAAATIEMAFRIGRIDEKQRDALLLVIASGHSISS